MATSGYTEFKDSKDEPEHSGPAKPAHPHPEELETPETGLTSAEAARRFARDGPNQLPEKHVNACLNFARYFCVPMPACI